VRIWDTVIISGEKDLDLLQARMEEMAGIPEVTHVIAEAETDYYGKPKPLWFREERADRFSGYPGRWNHVRVHPGELPAGEEPQVRKDALREYLAHAVAGEPGDIILHGSPDEIPAEWVIRELLTGEITLPVVLQMRWCAYAPGLVHPLPWKGTVAQKWQWTGSFSGLREIRNSVPAILGAGTRLSMLGEEVPEDMHHPDGHALWETEVDDTYPRWIRSGLSPQ
jgi:hypothetical protein